VYLNPRELLATLNTARASSPIDNDEHKAQLEKATFLPPATGIFHHGISWISHTRSASAQDKREAGTSHSRAGG
jgi:hypothetical protein